MLYVIGDSCTFGYNFYLDKEKDRVNFLYSKILSDKLAVNYKNISYPATSNWWIARQLHTLNLEPHDYVVIAWSNPDRCEFSISENSNLENSIVGSLEEFSNPDKMLKVDLFKKGIQFPDSTFFGQNLIEKKDNIYTTRISRGLMNNSQFISEIYTNYYNKEWFEYMSYALMLGVVYKLKNSQCRYRMFNAFTGFTSPYINLDLLRIKEYLLGPEKNMLSYVRNYDSFLYEVYEKMFVKGKNYYYSKEEHEKIALLLYQSFQEF